MRTDEILVKLRNLEEQLRNIDAKLSQLINSSPITRLYKKVFSGTDQQKLLSEKTGLFVQKTKLTQERINIVWSISNIKSEIGALEESKKNLALGTELDTQDLTKSKKEDFEKQEELLSGQIAEIDENISKIGNLISNLPYNQEEQSIIGTVNLFRLEESSFYRELEELKNLPELKEIKQNIEAKDREIKEIEERLQKLKEEIIHDAKIIGTTLTKTFTSEEIYRKPFDAVIIDEASMAPLPMLFFTSGLSKDKIIILGDFRQLAPIAIAESANAERWLRRDIYELTGIIENGGKLIEKKERHRLTTLIEQHRMHPNISYLSSELLKLYEDGLKNAEDTKTIMPDVAPAKGRAVCLVDTSDYNPWCNKTPDYSRLNIYDALVIKSLIKNHILKSDIKIEPDEIAVITPFKAQAKLISTILKESDSELQDILVASIHRFQGKERKVMIFDSTISYPEKSPPKLLQYTLKEDIDNTRRIINVAITRARNKLLIIGNSTYIQERLDKAHPLYKIISHIQTERGRGSEIIYSKAILPECFPEDLLAMEEKLFEPFFEKTEGVIKEFYTERDFFPQFRQDILKATKKVVISSPFITKNRLDYFINSFRQLIAKDVDIYIFTKPVKELPPSLKQLADEVSRLLTQEKCKIIYKPLLHNKVAVIDDKIFWMGSLNILSHRNTTETMVRFATPATPDTVTFLIKQAQINKFINTEKIFKKQKAFISYLKRELDKTYCDECGEVMNVKIGNYGPFFVCANNHIKNIGNKKLEELFPQVCPICGSPLVIKFARGRGRFWGCSRYPECKAPLKEIWDIEISE
jgi:ssDNA-binding Zn-finger/Zn-ribbon topoisomerase 1